MRAVRTSDVGVPKRQSHFSEGYDWNPSVLPTFLLQLPSDVVKDDIAPAIMSFPEVVEMVCATHVMQLTWHATIACDGEDLLHNGCIASVPCLIELGMKVRE